MRNSTAAFVDALKEYLQKSFSDRVTQINAQLDMGLPDIATWGSGFNAVLSGLTAYPGCLILVNGRRLSDSYTTVFNLTIGIGLTADNPVYLETIGQLYTDILEDTIRSDWHLGGACLDTAQGIEIQVDCVNNVYLIQAQLECEVDLGGFVYEDKNPEGEVSQVSEMSRDVRSLSENEGSSVLSALSQPDGAGDIEGAGEKVSYRWVNPVIDKEN